ncbi:MAG: tyrosine-type recombinase/integrase [Thermodesulfobacteriota bacterium]|nr:tyrosine-type recombinase/integrase [Thermodesulfobacteriota bacterium]
MACIRKRRGRYVIDFYDQNGKRRWKTLKAGTTKAQAKEELRTIEGSVARGQYLPERRVPLFSQVAKEWLKHKQPNVRHSTWKMYEGHVNLHLNRFDPLKVNRITTAKVEEFITECQMERMNLTTLRKILVAFGQIMAFAVRRGYCDHNPVRDAERPRSQGNLEDKKIQVLSSEQIQALLANTEGLKYQTLFMLAIFSGARQGELRGLKWTDLDLFNSQLRIERTFNKKRWYEPKSKTSIRQIDLGPQMIAQLKRWKLACPPSELDLMFPNDAGKPLDRWNLLKRHFYPALEAAKLPHFRFHDLRHTYASLLIEQGENIKYVQNQLGHSSPVVTLTVYAHLMKSVNQEAAVRLEKSIFEGTGSKTVAETKKGLTDKTATP